MAGLEASHAPSTERGHGANPAMAIAGQAWRSCVEAGRLPDAWDLIHGPSDAAPRLARIDILRAWGREHEAMLEVGRAAGHVGDDEVAFRHRAWAAMRAGRPHEAIACRQRLLALDPDDGDAMLGLGAALQAIGDHEGAVRWFRAGVERAPGDLAVRLAWGACEFARGRLAEAEDVFRHALAIAPASAAAREHLGIALAALHRHDDALDMLGRAGACAQASGEDVDAWVNIGIGLCETGRTAEGVRVLVDGLRERPHVNAFLQLGQALISLGHFRAGWRYFEHRWLAEPFASMRADLGVPHWSGQPLAGKTLLVRAEQGLGDAFQFVRYLPLLKVRGARVLFQPKGTAGIASRFPGVDRVVADGERLPHLDYVANLMSLPHAFGTTLETIPRDIPYLAADPARATVWASRLGDADRPRVGLVWAGRPSHRSDRLRSLDLEQLAPILRVEGVRFVSMQKGVAAAQAERVPASVDWTGIGPELDDLDDAAAALANLDLLISVDTGLAHLAGAMGKPVWVLLQSPSEYRWMRDREDTPWYPTLRLFRQDEPRAWGPAIDRVAASLRHWVDECVRDATPIEARHATPGVSGVPVASNEPARIPGLAVAAETRAGYLQFDPDEPVIGPSLDRYGEWLPARLDLILAFIRPGAVVIEVRAGAGAHTLPLARAAGDGGVVLAYEPRAAHRCLLAGNLAAHRALNVTLMTRALGAQPFAVDRETVDDLRLARLDGIKVNDGADALAIVRGAGATLWRCRPWLMLASEQVDAEGALRDAIREFGYRAWRVATPLHTATNFNRRDDDVFGGAQAQALFALPEEIDVRVSMPGCAEWP